MLDFESRLVTCKVIYCSVISLKMALLRLVTLASVYCSQKICMLSTIGRLHASGLMSIPNSEGRSMQLPWKPEWRTVKGMLTFAKYVTFKFFLFRLYKFMRR